MNNFQIHAISPDALTTVRSGGPDPFGNRLEPFTDTEGGHQLRCCLRRSEPAERIVLVAHAPLAEHSPWREVGPVLVHADQCAGYLPAGAVPGWFDSGPRVLRAYTTTGAMHYPANRIVPAGDGVAAALEAMFTDQDTEQVHIRNLLEQCFIARAVRQS